MTQQEVKEILIKAFSALDDEQIENLEWHLRNETPVYCGNEAMYWYDPKTGKG